MAVELATNYHFIELMVVLILSWHRMENPDSLLSSDMIHAAPPQLEVLRTSSDARIPQACESNISRERYPVTIQHFVAAAYNGTDQEK